MNPLRVHVQGIGVWSRQLGDFDALKQLLAGVAPAPPAARPPAVTLPPNERRRAPESVLLAVEVAAQAVQMSGLAADALTCVFASSHGDQAITDYMCRTLADAPAELSPIRFHNSVHNAPVGYWTIATGCHAPSTAIAAQRASFGAGLLEAASQVLADGRAALLVCSDIAGMPPLQEVTGCSEPFGCALVLAPRPDARTVATLELVLGAGVAQAPLPEPLAAWRAANASAAALPLLCQLALGSGACELQAAAALTLQVATVARA